MEPICGRPEDVEKGEEPAEDKAANQTPAPSMTVTPRRGLRERGAGRLRSAIGSASSSSSSSADVNGAASSPQSSGRVLRDRSTRAVPAWLKDTNKSDDEEDEPSPDGGGASKRRKVCNWRRKKHSEPEIGGGIDSLQGAE